MHHRLIVSVLALVTASGCSRVAEDHLPPVDRTAVLAISNEFMSDLVNDRIPEAISKFEPEFLAALGPGEAEAGVRSLLNYCGRPLDSELKHEEVGVKVYADGHKQSTHQFIYSATTTTHPKGECFFAVTMVSGAAGPRVTTFGPLKSPTGNPPDWAR